MSETTAEKSSERTLVDVKDLRVAFASDDGSVNAVNGVDFTLDRGEVLCILGESGSGKSVTMRALMKLLPEKKTTIKWRMQTYAGPALAEHVIKPAIESFNKIAGDDMQIEADDGDPNTIDGYYKERGTTVVDDLDFEGNIVIL